MPNYTIEKKDGSKVAIERKNLKEANKSAKAYGGKVVHAGNDLCDSEDVDLKKKNKEEE